MGIYPSGTEQLWSGVTFDPEREALSWEPRCPVKAVITLCRRVGESDCEDLANSTQVIGRRKVRSSLFAFDASPKRISSYDDDPYAAAEAQCFFHWCVCLSLPQVTYAKVDPHPALCMKVWFDVTDQLLFYIRKTKQEVTFFLVFKKEILIWGFWVPQPVN